MRSSKTAHHSGGGLRIVPVAPELQPILFDLFEQAVEGIDRLLPKIVDSTANLRTSFHKIIERAGHKPWPRLFQNLRGSCETDWVDLYPSHQVASWLGHSPSIAARHYLKSKDLHVQAATGSGDWIQPTMIKHGIKHGIKPAIKHQPKEATKVSKCSVLEVGAKSGALLVQSAVQNAVQHPAAPTRINSQNQMQTIAACEVVRDLAAACNSLQIQSMGDTGLEPVTSRV